MNKTTTVILSQKDLDRIERLKGRGCSTSASGVVRDALRALEMVSDE